MSALRRVPVGARTMGLPVGGTIIMLMLPRVFPELHGWPMGALWALWAIVWGVAIADIIIATRSGTISREKWEAAFGKADE